MIGEEVSDSDKVAQGLQIRFLYTECDFPIQIVNL